MFLVIFVEIVFGAQISLISPSRTLAFRLRFDLLVCAVCCRLIFHSENRTERLIHNLNFTAGPPPEFENLTMALDPILAISRERMDELRPLPSTLFNLIRLM